MKIDNIIQKVNSKVAKRMLGVSVERGEILEEEGEHIFIMLAKTPYGRVMCESFIPTDFIEDESAIVRMVSSGLIDGIEMHIEELK